MPYFMKFLILFATCVAIALACTCAPYPSLKHAFCAMDFVSLVRVVQRNSDDVGEFGSGFVIYHVQHLYVFRKPEQLEELSEYITTPSVSAACGVNLTVGEYYVLGGRVDDNSTLRISLCGLRRQWNTLERNETEALSTYTCDERY
ncbi:hypothetical protein Aduo_010326 [Ancylostoma duodenale]